MSESHAATVAAATRDESVTLTDGMLDTVVGGSETVLMNKCSCEPGTFPCGCGGCIPQR